MKILYAASESAPFMKTGGLADVAGSLPLALKKEGHDVRVVMPLYSKIDEKYKRNMTHLGHFFVDLNWRHQYAGVFSHDLDGVTYYFIDNEYYFDRASAYGEVDDGERFIFFSKAVVQLMKFLDFQADIVHANDWHTGLVPLYIKDFARGDSFYHNMKSVFTIHNMKYQGIFSASILSEVASLSYEYFHEYGLKYYDNINMMKGGIVYCDLLTTVSQTYSEEIKSSYFGENLEGVIQANSYKLHGVVNGIDYEKFNPKTDPNIDFNYTIKNLDIKVNNKMALQERYNLPVNPDIPMIGMVTRMVAMKGLDLVVRILDELLQENVQFVMLGTGDHEYEAAFKHFEYAYPDKVASRIYFNEAESHKVYAGVDLFLMPSLAEPCGISQLISLRYGTVPLTRETGGLKDTILPYNQFTGEGNGFSFRNQNAHELLYKLKDALYIYQDKNIWEALMRSGMQSKNDWEASSKEYIRLYNQIA